MTFVMTTFKLKLKAKNPLPLTSALILGSWRILKSWKFFLGPSRRQVCSFQSTWQRSRQSRIRHQRSPTPNSWSGSGKATGENLSMDHERCPGFMRQEARSKRKAALIGWSSDAVPKSAHRSKEGVTSSQRRVDRGALQRHREGYTIRWLPYG